MSDISALRLRGSKLAARGWTGEAAWWSALAALCVALGLPLLLADVPPLLDYPNHLARAVVLAFGAQDPVLSQMARAQWGLVPDLGTDLFLPPLLHILPVHVAGRITAGLALLLPVVGAMAYSRAALGGRSWFVLGVGLVAYGQSFLLGFLNFRIGIGLALLLAAAWMHWREAFPRRVLLLGVAGAVLLFFCHLMGLVLFALLLGAHELTGAFSTGRARDWLARGAMLAAVFAAPSVLYWLSPLETVAGDPVYQAPVAKLQELMVPFTAYLWWLDVATAALAGCAVIAGLATRRLTAAPGPLLALCLLLVAWLAAPFGFKGASHLDERFVTMAGLLVFACLRPVRLPWALGAVAVIGCAGLLALRVGVVGQAWWEHRADVAGLRAAIASVEPGSRVFVTSVSPAEAPGYWRAGPAARRLSDGTRTDTHMPALLMIERRAWWPFLFDNPSQQPVVQLGPYRRLALAAASMMPHHALDGAGINRVCGFDYVLLLEAGGEPALDDFGGGRLGLVVADDFAALFRVYPQFLDCRR